MRVVAPFVPYNLTSEPAGKAEGRGPENETLKMRCLPSVQSAVGSKAPRRALRTSLPAATARSKPTSRFDVAPECPTTAPPALAPSSKASQSLLTSAATSSLATAVARAVRLERDHALVPCTSSPEPPREPPHDARAAQRKEAPLAARGARHPRTPAACACARSLRGHLRSDARRGWMQSRRRSGTARAGRRVVCRAHAGRAAGLRRAIGNY